MNQPPLFDSCNLAEIPDDGFPGKRIMACNNPLPAERRRRKREDLPAASEDPLQKIAAEVA